MSTATDAAAPRRLGRTDCVLSAAGMGGATLGEVHEKIPEPVAQATLAAAWEAGNRYFDTSPWYGHGISELRFGAALRDRPRNAYVLSTKVGRWFFRPQYPNEYRPLAWKGGLPFDVRFDYTYDGIMRSYEQSLMRLGINTIDLLLIHDLDLPHVGSADLVANHFRELERSGFRALDDLKRHGDIRGIGAGVNVRGTIGEMLRRFDLDFFLVAMPYTLLDQDILDDEFPLCAERGVGIVIGSPFASGILATGSAAANPLYYYRPAPPEMIEKTRRLEAVCAAHGVPLKAAAFQFPRLNPMVASVISGAARPEQASENGALVHVAIPSSFWTDLVAEGLIRPDSLPPVAAAREAARA
jgi:D-threo-aldose 1-dehydrogenase